MTTVAQVDGGAPPDGTAYRYERFTTRLLLNDLRFHAEALSPGESFPRHELAIADAGTLTLGGPRSRPLLVVTGSITCPMTASAMPSLRELHGEFGDDVDFVMLSVREAHPGEHYPQPGTAEEKVERARHFQSKWDIPFAVVVDGIDGDLHRSLDGKPNAAYVVDAAGEVVFRAHWARDESALREVLVSVAGGQVPPKAASRAMIAPVARAMGSIDRVMRDAGPRAQRDLWRSAAPMALAGLVARAFPPLRPDQRGVAAVVALSLAGVATIGAVLAALL